MIQLSPDVVQFIQRNRSGNSKTNGLNQEQKSINLYCELYQVVSVIHQKLNRSSETKWSFCTDLILNDQKNPECSFGLHQKSTGALIDIKLNPFGASSIELLFEGNTRNENVQSDEIRSFYQTAAFKRYFHSSKQNKAHLLAAIPQRQLTSRHFCDYLLHIIEQMMPFLELIKNNQRAVLKAA